MRRTGLLLLILASAASCHSPDSNVTESDESSAATSDGYPTITAPAGPTCVDGAGLARPAFGLPEFQDILGKSQFYAQPQNFGLLFTSSWTNWYYDSMTTALAKLS